MQTGKQQFMRAALDEAKLALNAGEVPIGAVVVKDGKIIGRGHNVQETTQDATAHAEMVAIRLANHQQHSWRLSGAELFVTVEPCAMCCGAMILARIDKVYYGTGNQKAGRAGSLDNLLQDERLNHQTDVEAGMLETECRALMQTFFQQLRVRRKGNSRKPGSLS